LQKTQTQLQQETSYSLCHPLLLLDRQDEWMQAYQRLWVSISTMSNENLGSSDSVFLCTEM